MTNRCRRLLAQFFISLLACLAVSASTATRLDLSFLHRVKSSTLADVIRNALEKNENVYIDISSSLIGKDMTDILSILNGNTKNEAVSINLKARSNHWSQKEATMLLKVITASENAKRRDEETEDTKTDEDAGEASKSDIQDGGGRVSVVGLDLGWNDFNQENRESKVFLKSLQKIVQESSLSPQSFVLRLDVCALNPAACRAIGKVSRFHSQREIAKSPAHWTKSNLIVLL
jgi:hypothetical protein